MTFRFHPAPTSGPSAARRLRLLPPTLAAALLALVPLSAAAHQIENQDHQVHSDDDTHERRVVVETAHPRLWQLRQGGYLGVRLVDLTPELRTHFGVDKSAGVLVGTVAQDSPASTAGLLVGDIITSIDGETIGDRGEVVRQVGGHEAGDAISIEVFRDGSYEVLLATVEERDRPQLWLNTLSEGPDMRMEWRTNEDGFFVLPSPAGKRLEIHGERLDQVMGSLHERLASPDFSARMLEFSSNTEELENRIKELEQRLLELSKQLEELVD